MRNINTHLTFDQQ